MIDKISDFCRKANHIIIFLILLTIFISILAATVAVVLNLLGISEYYLFYGYLTIICCLWLLTRNEF